MSKTVEISGFFHTIGRDDQAGLVSHLWDKWNQERQSFVSEVMETRDYLYATDTTTTSNANLPHSNTTTIPKLRAIADLLISHYITGLMPNERWLQWETFTKDPQAKQKRNTIQAYMSNKAREGSLRTILISLLTDYVEWGSVFTDVEYVNENHTDPATGEVIPGYVGPKLVRINPNDIVFNPTAVDFKKTPKIVRSLHSIGDLKADLSEKFDSEHLELAISRRLRTKNLVNMYSRDDVFLAQAYQVDGFGSLQEYYGADVVELLELTGDFYDAESDTLLKNHVITIMDRTTVLRSEPLPTWKRHGTIEKVSWRDRPGNLWGMGPLANLVGLQYRIDHLENARAGMFDLMVDPPLKVIGDVEDFSFGPHERIDLVDKDSDVRFFEFPTTALTADTKIAYLMELMEEMAGAPKQAAGIRTPGEKTKFEVQQLDNASGRTFQEKMTKFEIELLEPSLNNMLENSRRNMVGSDQIRVMDDELGVMVFNTITKEDITAAGKIRPIGARHFSQQANALQDLAQLSNTRLWDDIRVHISSQKLSDMVENLMGIDQFGIIQKHAQVIEEAETQQVMNEAQQVVDNDLQQSQELL